MDTHVINKINKSWEVGYVIKVRQLFSKHGVSKVVRRYGGGRYKQKKCCCEVL